MNAEYQSHKRVWEMLKPKVYARIEPREPLAWARPPAVAPASEFLGSSLARMDPAVLAHGLRELAWPLSEW
jgi:hypothetical protein